MSGTVALSTTTSADTIQVTFERSPAGAGTWTTIAVDSSAPFSASFDTSLLADGLYDLRAVASDGAATVTSNVRHDAHRQHAPTGSMAAPIAGATVGGPSVTLAASAADSGSGVATVQFRVDGAPVGTASSTPWTIAWDADVDAERGAHDRRGRHRRRRQLVHHARRADHGRLDTAERDARRPGHAALRQRHAVGRIPGRRHRTCRLPGEPGRRRRLDGGRDDATPRRTAALSTRQRSPTASTTSGRSPTTAAGNVSAPSIVASRRIDNTPPSVVSATPPTARRSGSAGSIAVTASEALSAVTGATLDGGATRRSRPSPARSRRSPPGRSPTDLTPWPARSSTPPARPRRSRRTSRSSAARRRPTGRTSR